MNRILYAADCLKVLTDRDALPDESVDLIYLDPPFNSNSRYNLPFKGRYKSARPVEAFVDTWHWTDENTVQLEELDADPRTRPIADIVRFAQGVDSGATSLAAYLLNMAVRLRAMHRVLKTSGSIYLHCDPTASHYLKLIMDAVFGQKNFLNEVIWYYRGAGVPKKARARRHDILLWFAKKNGQHFFNPDPIRRPYAQATIERFENYIGNVRGDRDYGQQELNPKGKHPDDVIDYIQPIAPSAKDRTGYPTQKPDPLLEGIIKSSTKRNDIILDPFCGCGTTVLAAESLGRRWIGIDISTFATGLVRDRVRRRFPNIAPIDFVLKGVPETISEAKALAKIDKFEFEKWVCGHIGAEGMFHDPGTPGADGGVDGVLRFYRIRRDQKLKPEYAIIQVKGGRVSPDSVRALRTTVDRFEVTAGVMVCFDQFMATVENQRSRDTFRDELGTYPVIQGYSVESLLENVPLNLPLYGLRRQGARLIA